MYLGDRRTPREWADRLALGECLGQLIAACERLDYPRAGACTDSYLERTSARRPLMEALTVAAAKLQNDPHQQRHAASMIEEWEQTTLPARDKDDLLRAWTKYTAGGVKRTTALDCVRMFEEHLNLGQSVIFTPNGQQHDMGVMGLTLTKPVEND
jgi:hypothetical protein